MQYKALLAFTVACALFAGAQAQTWFEQGDAGDLPETAQSTGSGSLSDIQGTLDTNDVDMYAIYISDPASFSASTVGGASWDTQLFLFDADGKGIVAEDDTGGLQSTINNANNCIPSSGLYYLAITRYNKDPLGCNDGGLWSTNDNNCPNGPESTSRVASWTTSTGTAGTYTIFLTGVEGATAGDPADCPPFEGWDETNNGGGDAGDLPGIAQIVTSPDAAPCQTPVNRIRGDLEDDGVDMYVICITDPASFVATTVGSAGFDTQLWLFNCDGTGVAFNDDSSSGTQSTLDNSSNCIGQAGTYLLAISRYNRDAVDANGNLIWNNSPFTGVRCPDGPGASNPIASWTGATEAGGRYIIQLQGAYFVSEQGCQTTQCEGDVNSDGTVDDADLLQVLFAFGCSGFCGPSDVNQDGTVDDADLLIVLFNFGCGA